MALLTWRFARGPLLASSASIVVLGCSFVLDTTDLKKGGDAGTPPTGTADAANDALVCSFPDRDVCSDCLSMYCCTETYACTGDTTCNIAFVEFQRCQRAAKKAPNPGIASGLCTQAFVSNGGQRGAGMVGCSVTNCSMPCGSQ